MCRAVGDGWVPVDLEVQQKILARLPTAQLRRWGETTSMAHLKLLSHKTAGDAPEDERLVN